MAQAKQPSASEFDFLSYQYNSNTTVISVSNIYKKKVYLSKKTAITIMVF